MKTLVALPVYNEVSHIDSVLQRVKQFADQVLVVDDGSTDGTTRQLAAHADVLSVRHPINRGYGAALRSAFEFAIRNGFEAVVTIDCDGQHEPQRIPELIGELHDCDIVSGSRYLKVFDDNSQPPEDRWAINRMITAEINQQLGLQLTDTFCGFKAYRTSALRDLRLSVDGYAMPLEFWVQAAAAGLRIKEVAVPLIYLDEERSFGGSLDDSEIRLQHYRDVIRDSLRLTLPHDHWMCDELSCV
jgi:dolichol-phosphate mannosyltransferase